MKIRQINKANKIGGTAEMKGTGKGNQSKKMKQTERMQHAFKAEKTPWENKRMQRSFAAYMVVVLLFTMGSPVLASGDPLAVVNNLSNFIFGLIRAIGMILLGFGIVQVGLSLKSHDPSQRANGFLTVAGGIIITFAKEILNLIAG